MRQAHNPKVLFPGPTNQLIFSVAWTAEVRDPSYSSNKFLTLETADPNKGIHIKKLLGRKMTAALYTPCATIGVIRRPVLA